MCLKPASMLKNIRFSLRRIPAIALSNPSTGFAAPTTDPSTLRVSPPFRPCAAATGTNYKDSSRSWLAA